MPKKFYTMGSVGLSKYLVNFHDGVKTHRDGSEFYDIKIFRDKRKRDQFIRGLKKQGYREGFPSIGRNPRRKSKRYRVRNNYKKYSRRSKQICRKIGRGRK